MAATELTIKVDTSAFELHLDACRRLIAADPRRALEIERPYYELKARDLLCFAHPLELAGELVQYVAPSPQFVALYETLRLRSRLNLPTGEVAA